ncbi:hypothetical protein [Mesorhizobium sp.]|uniref:hypothetical protein n=1 Tax=Mesorhizobium sp. TaxID=1871066 RepID=UPI000FE4F86F|nr:hypothetical protein [Mesorhizobium sp.]RWK65607.1 MAG: hypothetical protein EOR49_00435 [Mesorhizobium sp.]RWM60807.1 MAG: hypothetical protein EOR78_02410 [Mesorhizobium sp.]RWM62001.1 MAG: hypothetical protein EOR79_00020 [Mesorhizobium sp.]RWN03775.1 MAG: hypothetical protein EOR84_02050 [Mesorhizobium sp.]RWN04656.1 MAG: hypothetical protein EOR85_03140 [Mesorhizobium sp.]
MSGSKLGAVVPSFCSFLVFEPSQTELVMSLCRGTGWNVRFIPDPSKRYKFHKSGHSEVAQPRALADFGSLGEGETHGQLLVVEAERTEANNIIQLIRAANVVVEGFPDQKYGNPSGFGIPDDASEQSSIFKDIFQTNGFFELFSFKMERPVAVAMAVNAWSDRRIVYAIHKLSKSYETEAITPWSAHPRYGQIFEKHSGEFSDHVRSSIAINLAFSAIEEMNLQVNSSREKPRWLDDKYTWNPIVLKDIKSRLEKVGINPERTVDWVVRGDETELTIQPARDRFSDYGDGQKVRDIEFPLPDAIHACSYLRNFMTAHAFGKETQRLGPYEVYNVQQVARFLILSICGLFNVWTRNLSEQMALQLRRDEC